MIFLSRFFFSLRWQFLYLCCTTLPVKRVLQYASTTELFLLLLLQIIVLSSFRFLFAYLPSESCQSTTLPNASLHVNLKPKKKKKHPEGKEDI